MRAGRVLPFCMLSERTHVLCCAQRAGTSLVLLLLTVHNHPHASAFLSTYDCCFDLLRAVFRVVQ